MDCIVQGVAKSWTERLSLSLFTQLGMAFMLWAVLLMCDSHSVVSDSYYPMDCSPPGSSVHGTLQARILKWIAIPFSRGSSRPRD